MPNDHVRLIVELLRPLGPELARRWLAALMLAPEHERAAVVSEIERHLVSIYTPSMPPLPEGEPAEEPTDEVEVVHPPVERDGYVEQTRVRYGKVDDRSARARKAR